MSSSERWVSCRMFKSRTVDRMAFSAEGLTAGGEAAEQFIVPRTSDHSRAELVPEEVKRDVRVPPLALTILAIDDLGFGGMHLQAPKRFHKGLTLRTLRRSRPMSEPLQAFSFGPAFSTHASVRTLRVE